ncbi:UNVERIFIED_CONTAM: hypothetical protein GTU68_049682 [Idotea baltica]|nr:hypothetical protein [Idotea baltica]
MGILNVTPDSFYDGGVYNAQEVALKRVEAMLNEGADIIDVGGMSSRPGAGIIDTQTELKRVLPVIELIIKHYPETIISIDTVKAEVAEKAIELGASIINDISAGILDKAMFETVAKLQVPYILMHMQGKPESMQNNPTYRKDIIENIIDFFVPKVFKLEELGVKDIIIDCGFGFGKTIAHNYEILKRLSEFKVLGKSILAGVSRKSMIYKILNCSAKDALNGTTVLHTLALQSGASILRVHDVKQAKETITLLQQLNA